MQKVIVTPLKEYNFGSYDDLPACAKTPEFEPDPPAKPEPRLRLVVNNEED